MRGGAECDVHVVSHVMDPVATTTGMDPNSEGPLYCSEQIKIPAELPDILKEFTKAAIRTQPADLLQWSAA